MAFLPQSEPSRLENLKGGGSTLKPIGPVCLLSVIVLGILFISFTVFCCYMWLNLVQDLPVL